MQEFNIREAIRIGQVDLGKSHFMMTSLPAKGKITFCGTTLYGLILVSA
jgi:hypothetical protein